VQRNDARFVKPSDLHDPEFARAAREAARAGVQFRAALFEPNTRGFLFQGLLPVRLAPYSYRRLEPYRARFLPDSGWIRRSTNKVVANT
jgi:hypothetical protein